MKKLDKIINILEIPREITRNIPKIVVTGFDEILIENYKGILEYGEFFIKINTYIGVINVHGFCLELQEITCEDIAIKGTIKSIEFEKN